MPVNGSNHGTFLKRPRNRLNEVKTGKGTNPGLGPEAQMLAIVIISFLPLYIL